ncbi:MAG: outer membrane protein assembly factor BamD [Mariprofundales bacterium]
MRSWWMALLTALLLLGGCASDKATLSEQAELDYNKGTEMVEARRFGQAAVFLEKFSSKHPYSKYAASAELLRVYAAYMDSESVLSEVLAERFLDKHPAHPNRDYAMYMLAMSHYKERATPERDPTHIIKSVETFRRLIKAYPQSAYAADGQARIQQLSNELAGHELAVARYYFDHDRLVAAANRLQGIVEHYQTSPQIEEALYLLASCYHTMHLEADAQQVAQLLATNYPDSSWSARVADLRE